MNTPDARRARRRLQAVVASVLLVGLLATVVLVQTLSLRDDRTRAVALDARTREAGERVNSSVGRAFDAAVAVRALLGHRPDTTAEEFRAFTTDGGLLRGFPRISALSFARWIPQDGSVVVELIEPLEPNRAALGLDLTSEARRREAVERARDRGVPTASAPIPLVQDDLERPGLLLLLPVYVDGQSHATGPERRRNFLGVASMVLRADVLLASVLPPDSEIDLQVDDIGPVDLDGDGTAVSLLGMGQTEGPRATVDINVGDRRWRLTGTPNDRFPEPSPAALIALLAGLALTLAGATLTWSMGSARAQAERLVRDRTLELLEANEQLVAADHAKSTFLATVSHELRTPLTSIIGFLAVLRRGDDQMDPARREDLLLRMDRNSRSLLSLIEDLLAFSRLERGAQDVEPTILDLGATVGAALDALDPLLAKATLERQLASDIQVLAAPSSIDRIVMNLVTNAVKYGGASPRITVSVTRDQEWGAIVVSDEGPGIRPDERERIFEQFERGTRTIRTAGTGIGLTVVRQLAQQHHGEVTLEDSDIGARFLVRLPIATAEAAPAGS